tara:strand:- start:145 stop:771 length:627 start_codon:yes stop_codon:yes gene_type:complete
MFLDSDSFIFTIGFKSGQVTVFSENKMFIKGNLEFGVIDNENKQLLLTTPVHNNENLVSGETLYQWFESKGYKYGSDYQRIEQLSFENQRLVADFIATHENVLSTPGFIDSALQATAGYLVDSTLSETEVYLPFSIDSIHFERDSLGSVSQVVVEKLKKTNDASSQKFDIDLIDSNKRSFIRINGFLSIFNASSTEISPNLSCSINSS